MVHFPTKEKIRHCGSRISRNDVFSELSQDCAQLGFQGGQNLGGDALGVGVGQGPIVGPELQGEGHGLLAYRDTIYRGKGATDFLPTATPLPR